MASLSDLAGAGWRQHARLLTLTTPAGPDALLAESARIDEALGPVAGHAGFRIEVTALATDAALSLAELLGQPARLDLQTAASRSVLRPFHGHITQITRLGANGGFARYRLLIEPWLALLGHNRDSYLFQDKTVVEIVDEVFAGRREQGRLAPAWRWDLADPASHPRRGMCVQYGESDLAFVRRLLVEEALCCHFEHEAGEGDGLGGHTLVISDHGEAFRPSAQPLVRFTPAGATLAEDSLDRWSAHRQLDSTMTHAASWDYHSRSARPATAPGSVADGATPEAVAWHDTGPGAWPTAADGQRRLDARRDALDARLAHYDGEGTLRSAAPGNRFVLVDHPGHLLDAPEAREFLVTAVHHQVRNNLAERFPELLAALGPAEPDESAEAPLAKPADFYRNRLVAQRAMLPWRPLALDAFGRPLYSRPDAARPLTAIVVGPGSHSHTDRDLRIRVQFQWQRGSLSASRRGHPGGADNASVSDALGAWLRVITPVAGANWGGHLPPRPGQEVLVAFLHGDPDRPVVIGAFYNGQGNPDAPGNRQGSVTGRATSAAPAFFAGEAAAHAHGASLSGIRTQALATGGGPGACNQLVFDDSLGQGQIGLGATGYASRLQLGRLKHQQGNARLADRGLGAELATQAAAALRAGGGLLLSADARPNAAGRHLDSGEAIACSEAARDVVLSLADAAKKQRATFEGDPPPAELPAVEALGHAIDALGGWATQAAGSAGRREILPTGGGVGSAPAWP